MAKGKHVFRGVVEVPYAKDTEQAVNLGQVKDLLDRYNKEPVKVVATEELVVDSVESATGKLTLTSTITKIDNIQIEVGDEILLVSQTDKTQNGVYVVEDLNTPTLVRRDDFAVGKVILNNTFVNVMQGTTKGDTRWTIVSDGVLTCGTSNFTFIKDVDTASGSVNVIKSSITGDGSTTSFNIAHNINLTDAEAYVVYVKDNTGSNVFVDNAPTVGNEKNSITLTFDVAPETTETFKVFILGLE